MPSHDRPGRGRRAAAHTGEGDLHALPRRERGVRRDGHRLSSLPRPRDGEVTVDSRPAAETAMPRWQRGYIIATCAIIGFAFAYAACDWGQWPKLVYLPITGELTMSPPTGAISIVYWGSLLWGLGGAACGALVGVLL